MTVEWFGKDWGMACWKVGHGLLEGVAGFEVKRLVLFPVCSLPLAYRSGCELSHVSDTTFLPHHHGLKPSEILQAETPWVIPISLSPVSAQLFSKVVSNSEEINDQLQKR